MTHSRMLLTMAALAAVAALLWFSLGGDDPRLARRLSPTGDETSKVGATVVNAAPLEAVVDSRTNAMSPWQVELGDGSPLAARFLPVPAGSDKASSSPVVISNEQGIIEPWPVTSAPATVSLSCQTYPWLRKGIADEARRAFVVPGGRLIVSVGTRVPTKSEVRVELSSRSNKRLDQRRQKVSLDGAVDFLMAEPGAYSVRASTEDGVLYATLDVEWRPGVAPIQLWLELPGSGVLALSVIDKGGNPVTSFAVELTGPEGFRRLVHSEQFARDGVLTGLPAGPMGVKLIHRLREPPDVYVEGSGVHAALTPGEIKRVVLKARPSARYRLEARSGSASDAMAQEWEAQAFCSKKGAWQRISMNRFVEIGLEVSNGIRRPGIYYTDALQPTHTALRLVRPVRSEQPDAVITIDAPPRPGEVVAVSVTLP